MSSFVRRVKTASGATAVQIVHKRGRDVVGIDHIGSAHDDAAVALLLHAARERRHAGQQALELDLDTAPAPDRSGHPVVEATGSLILWDALSSVYDVLGFSAVRDEAFRALVLGRIIEPTSKVDTVRVLTEVGVGAPSRATSQRCLRRIVERDYRDTVSNACYTHATRGGGLALVLYDLTTLYFETPREDGLRKVGMSKERRVDPQVTVGLLTDRSGFPLAVHLFEGNKAETKTVVPVLAGFRDQHPDAGEVIVVADAGMLSAANLLALEDAGFRFIVGSKSSKAPYDLADHLERHGNAFDDGQTLETTRTMGTGKKARDRRVVWQWSFKRYRHDIQAINAMVERAEAVAAGKRALKKDRFVRITDAAMIDHELYLPRCWTDNPDRLTEAGVPDDIDFATKPALAAGMLRRALRADVPARWVAGDEVYGNDPVLRAECEAHRIGYVLAIGCDRRVATPAGLMRADQLTASLPRRAWQRLSAGSGAKGQRYYDWAWVTLTPPEHTDTDAACWWLLVRRHRSTGELAFYRCYSPELVPLRELVRVAGRRWTVEESFQAAKGLAGLDEHQVRRWTSWHRWTLLAMVAHALLAVIAAHEHTDRPAPTGLVALTCNEIRRLFTIYVIEPRRNRACPRAWSDWRRRHQHRARTSHYQRQEAARAYT